MAKLNINLPPPTKNIDFDQWVIQTTQYLRDYLGTTDWVAPTLLNSWANYGSGYCNVSYCKDGEGFVHIRGVVAGGSAATDVFVLPTGYTPSTTQVFTVATYSFPGGFSTVGAVSVLANGSVNIGSIGGIYTSLDGITFYAG